MQSHRDGAQFMKLHAWMLLPLLSLIAACGGGGGGGGGGPGGSQATTAPPTSLSYSSPAGFVVGQPVAQLVPTVTGTVSGYSVSPTLPVGLTLNATTGVISGTPTAVHATTLYVV